ncbi:MAG: tetratricopeptide repeat protein, partial [Bacteroidota bacterium]
MRSILAIFLFLLLIDGNLFSMQKDSTDYMALFNQVRLRNIDSAKLVAQLAIDQGNEIGDSLLIVRGATAKGWSLEQTGDYEGAVVEYKRGLKIAENNGYRSREKFILNKLGIIHGEYANFSEALKYHLRSLVLREEDGALLEIATTSNNIGLIYYRISDYDLAIQYLQTGLRLMERTNSDTKTALVNLGLCYTGLGQNENALSYYERVLKLCNEDSCSPEIFVTALNGAGYSYETSDLLKSRNYFRRGVDMSRMNDLTDRLAIGLYNLSRIELKNGNINEALDLVKESQDIALSYGYRRWIKNNYRQLGAIYSSLDNYQLAYQFQRKYDSLNSEILNEGIIKNMAKIQADYQERENLQTIQNQDQEISRTNTLLFLSVVIIVLISIIVFILYRINQLRRKANRQLSEAKNTIEQQNNILEEKVRERTKELNETNAALMKSNTDLDNFIY